MSDTNIGFSCHSHLVCEFETLNITLVLVGRRGVRLILSDGICASVDGLEISRCTSNHPLTHSIEAGNIAVAIFLSPPSLAPLRSSSAEFVHVTLSPWCVHSSTDERPGGRGQPRHHRRRREASDENRA